MFNWLFGGAASTILNAVEAWLANILNAIIQFLLGWFRAILTNVSNVNLCTKVAGQCSRGEPGFYTVYYQMMLIALGLGMAMLLIKCIESALRGSLAPLKAALPRFFIGVVASFTLPYILPMIQKVFVQWTNDFFGLMGAHPFGNSSLLGLLSKALLYLPGGGAILIGWIFIFLGILMIIGTVITLIALILSLVVVYLTAVFFPVIIQLSPRGTKKATEVILVALATPTLITIVFTLGYFLLLGVNGIDVLAGVHNTTLIHTVAGSSGVNAGYPKAVTSSAPGTTPTMAITDLAIGAILICSAAFSPLGIMKLIPIAEEGISHLGSIRNHVGGMAAPPASFAAQMAKSKFSQSPNSESSSGSGDSAPAASAASLSAGAGGLSGGATNVGGGSSGSSDGSTSTGNAAVAGMETAKQPLDNLKNKAETAATTAATAGAGVGGLSTGGETGAGYSTPTSASGANNSLTQSLASSKNNDDNNTNSGGQMTQPLSENPPPNNTLLQTTSDNGSENISSPPTDIVSNTTGNQFINHSSNSEQIVQPLSEPPTLHNSPANIERTAEPPAGGIANFPPTENPTIE